MGMPKFHDDLQAIHHGHVQVCNHQVRRRCAVTLDAVKTVFGLDDFVPYQLQCGA
jgi:hypothetical protein